MENTVDEISHALSGVNLEGGKSETRTGEVAAGRDVGDEEARLWETLKALHCPFTWDDVLEIEREDKGMDRCKARLSQIEEKLEEIAEPDSFQYRKLVLNVVLVYEHFADGDPGGALAVQRETEALLSSWSPGAGDALSRLVAGAGDALRHVVLACRAHLQFRSRVLGEAGRTLARIVPFERLDAPCRAAVSGLRAAVLMEFGYRGNIAALKHAEDAVARDPDQGEWHFLLGKCLGRLRRIDHSYRIPDKLELKSLEEAARLTKHPPYIVFLAQAYRETAFRVFSETRHSATKSTVKSAIDKMNEKSLTLYKEALQLRGECSHINVRCALGFMKLPHPFKDVARAKRCLDVALELAPNNAMVNHVTAQFYQHNERDLAAAKKYYERASELGAFGSYMDLLRLRYQERRSEYDPLPDLGAGLDRYTEGPYRQELVMQMGSYHLFVRDDVEAAYEHWGKVIDEDPDSEKLRAHKCVFLPMLKPVNVYEVLCDESRLVLQLQPHRAKGKEPLYRQIILKCRKHHPSCVTGSPVARRKMVLAEVEEVERARCRPKTRGRGRGRGGERGRGYRGRGNDGQGLAFSGNKRGGYDRRYASGDNYSNRHQSSERRGSSRDDYSNRHQSSERRGSSRDNYSNRHQSGERRGTSGDNYSNRHQSGERQGPSGDKYNNRDQSGERRGSTGDNYSNRHQSGERQGPSEDNYSNKHQSSERRGSTGDNYSNRHQSGERRGTSGDNYSNRHQSGERQDSRGDNYSNRHQNSERQSSSRDDYSYRHQSGERRGTSGDNYSNRHQSGERQDSRGDNYSNRHQSGERRGPSVDNYSNRHQGGERQDPSGDNYSDRHQSGERRDPSGDDYSNRHQSGERRGPSVDNYSNRHQGGERQDSRGDNYSNRHQSGERRDPIGDDYSNRHQSSERRGFGRNRGGNRPYGTASHRGRDTSSDGYNRHHSHERRGFGGNRGGDKSHRTGSYPGRDSSREDSHRGASCERRGSYPGRYGEDGRSGVQSYRGRDEHGRDSNSCGSTRPRERGDSDGARRLSAGRVRTDSDGSVNSCPDEARVDWKKGCQASSSPVVDKDFADASNSHLKEQHKELKKNQEGYKMWWDE